MYINQNPNFGTHNTSVRNGNIEYIAIHYVGATGDAKANIDYYNKPTTTNASADFYVGHNGDIWQYNPDPKKRYCWAIGGKKQSNYGGALYGIAKNSNTVSIEMCVLNSGDKSANSIDWVLNKATYDSTIELTKHLMNLYGIDESHVIRHFDVNGKACPGIIGWNTYPNNNESEWIHFKNAIRNNTVDPLPFDYPENVKHSVGDTVKVFNHYTEPNGTIPYKVEPSMDMKIIEIVMGTLHPYHSNHNTWFADTDIEEKAINFYMGVPCVYSSNILDLQKALNGDNHRVVENGIFTEDTWNQLSKLCLSTKTKWKDINVTAWVQCRVGATPDGVYGSKTADCVKAYQFKKGLSADGICGKNTLLQLVKDYV